MNDVDCPYCGSEQEICHDDGYGYAENRRHRQKCGSCGNTFVYETCIIIEHEAYKADCLNGGEHKLSPSHTHPIEFSMMHCGECDYIRFPTTEEWKKYWPSVNLDDNGTPVM
jgi:hypothetical protein